MNELIIATKNEGKVREFKAILEKKGLIIKSLLDLKDAPDVEETGTTFKANALLKAKEMASYFQKPVIADDSGLSIDALDGRPGVISARYAGPEKNDQKNNEKVLTEMEHVPENKRTARFHCAIAVAFPNGQGEVFEATCEGIILDSPKGQNGFGYDPIMFIPAYHKTMAELSTEEKNNISHRAKALKLLEEKWSKLFRDNEVN